MSMFSHFGHWLSKGAGNVVNGITHPGWSGFWNGMQTLDPLLHGVIDKTGHLDDVIGAKVTGRLGMTGPANFFNAGANDSSKSALHHGLAGLAYLGGASLLGGGGGGGAAELGADSTAVPWEAGIDAPSAAAPYEGALGESGIPWEGGIDAGLGQSAADAGLYGGNPLAMSGGFGAPEAINAGQMAGESLMPSTTSSGFGGSGFDPSVMSPSTVSGGSGGADVLGSWGNWNIDPSMVGKMALKYGPAALSLMGALKGGGKGPYDRAAAAYGNIGTQQRQTASGLVSAYNNGTLNPAESAGIDTWAQQQVAALKQYFAQSGQSDSTQAQQAIGQVMAQAEQMKNQARENLLKLGLNELNGLDQNTAMAVRATLQGDIAAQEAQSQFMEQFAKLLGQTVGG